MGRVDVIRARFRLPLAEDVWVRTISRSFPDATFRLLTGVPKGDRSIELGEVRAATVEPVVEAIRAHPDIVAYDAVYADDQRAIAQYEAVEQSLYEFLWESSLPPEFPIIIEDGEMEFDLTATQEQFDAFGARLDARDREYDLLSVVHTDEDHTLLTDRQQECLATAHRMGYFAVPRECTVAELADTLEVDKSTASETVRRATGRIVEQFLVERDSLQG